LVTVQTSSATQELMLGNSPDKLATRDLTLKQQIWGGEACLHCYPVVSKPIVGDDVLQVVSRRPGGRPSTISDNNLVEFSCNIFTN